MFQAKPCHMFLICIDLYHHVPRLVIRSCASRVDNSCGCTVINWSGTQLISAIGQGSASKSASFVLALFSTFLLTKFRASNVNALATVARISFS